MDYDRLAAFMAVAHHGGFTAAARAVGKTQSALSQAVGALEEDLGQPLFVRQGRGVSITEAGRVLLEHAEQAFATLAAAERRLSALAGLEAGQLTVGASDTLAYHALPPVLRAFRAAHPGVELTLRARPSPDTARAVAQREVDLGIVAAPLPPTDGQPEPRLERLMPLHEVAIVPPDHGLAGRRRLRLQDLAGEPLLLLRRGTAGRAHLERELAAVGVVPRVAMEMDSVELLKRLVELGLGVSVVPALAVEREAKAGLVAAVPLAGLADRREVALALPPRDPIAPAAAAFAALARKHLRKSS